MRTRFLLIVASTCALACNHPPAAGSTFDGGASSKGTGGESSSVTSSASNESSEESSGAVSSLSCVDPPRTTPTGRVTSSRGLVLFGGKDTGAPKADTWRWDGTAWTELDVTGPAARVHAVMAPFGGSLVLFGGQYPSRDDNLLCAFADTWTWDGGAWAEVPVSGPPATYAAAMAPLGGDLVLLFGDPSQAGEGSPSVITWTWNGTAWSGKDVAGPPARSGSAMAPLGGELVLPPGGASSIPASVNPYDPWTWDGTDWTEVHATGPSRRVGAVMAPLDGKLVLFGGYNELEAVDLADTWTWDGASWTQLAVTGPSARDGAVMAAFQGRLILFGGLAWDRSPYDDAHLLSDTWAWDGRAWTQLDGPGPSARQGAVMATWPVTAEGGDAGSIDAAVGAVDAGDAECTPESMANCQGTPGTGTGTPYCAEGKCVVCFTPNDCVGSDGKNTGYCTPEGTCEPCTSDAQCMENNAGLLCYGGKCGPCEGPC